MSPIKTARSLARPPARRRRRPQPRLMFCQGNSETLFSTSHQRWKFHYPVDGYRLTITEGCGGVGVGASVKYPKSMSVISVSFLLMGVFLLFLPGSPHKIFQLAGTNCHPHTIWEAEMQLDGSTCKAKKRVQMDQKRERGFLFFSCVF